MKFGYRTFKTALGTVLAIYLAYYFNLEHYTAAGILTILCIQPTRKGSLKSAWIRFSAALLGMVFSIILFNILGYEAWVIGLLLLLFIPTTVKLKLTSGIVTSSVIIMHIFTNHTISISFILNELFILIIGIGVALIMNIYMPSLEQNLEENQKQTEQYFKKILEEISAYLEEGDRLWDGREIMEVEKLIQASKSLAFRDIENHFRRYDNTFYHYFKMREKQLEIIEQMLPVLSSLSASIEHSKTIGIFIKKVSQAVHPGNTAMIYLDELNQMKDDFKKMPLPESRQEFEIRASLYHFLNQMEQYLQIKLKFKEN